DRGLLARAVEQYREALRLDPARFWAHFQLARCYLVLGQGAEAVEALGACVALRPDSAWGYSTRGFALAILRRYPEAEADLNRALEIDPEALPARLNRGVVYREEGKQKEALADFAAVLAAPADRRLIEAAYYRGQLYLQRGDLDQARADFDRVVREKPSFRPAYLFRAQVRLARGEGARALEDLNAYLAEDGRFDADSPRAREQRGRQLRYLATRLPAAARKAALQLALADLQKAAEWPGGSHALFLDLGGVLENLGRADDALRAYSRGLKAAPADVKLRTARGWLYAGLNRTEQAHDDFAAAVRADPTFSEAHTGLGYVEARRRLADAAGREADLALLYGSGDYLMLHNVACIHAALAEGKDGHAREHEDVALALLRRAVELWKRGGAGPNEIDQIKTEPAFGPALRKRAEFVGLVQEKAP
ncbi:MAG TPA: tetratricopeptide repeat protein, partial [Gemmataceae bacterium]|nr:tetratricopeptide repeat protein [Gemmataceae bacterium]